MHRGRSVLALTSLYTFLLQCFLNFFLPFWASFGDATVKAGDPVVINSGLKLQGAPVPCKFFVYKSSNKLLILVQAPECSFTSFVFRVGIALRNEKYSWGSQSENHWTWRGSRSASSTTQSYTTGLLSIFGLWAQKSHDLIELNHILELDLSHRQLPFLKKYVWFAWAVVSQTLRRVDVLHGYRKKTGLRLPIFITIIYNKFWSDNHAIFSLSHSQVGRENFFLSCGVLFNFIYFT